VAWQPESALAQTQASAPPREHLTIGGTIGPGLGNQLWLMSSIRVSAPLGSRIGLDLDAGRVFGSNENEAGSHTEYGALFGIQVRFLRGARKPSGSRQYWVLGPIFIRDISAPPDGPRDHLKNFRLGYGWDDLSPNGGRIALEVGLAGGEGPVPYAIVIVQWGRATSGR